MCVCVCVCVVCMYVCMYVCDRDKLEQSAHVVKCPESVADRANGFGRVQEGENRAKTGLSPNSWKSASLQKVSQTDALALRDSQEFKTVLNSIGTGVLEVCEYPESVTDRGNG